MIAMKREVATLSSDVGFPWSECQWAAKQSQNHDDKSLYKQMMSAANPYGLMGRNDVK